MATLSISSTISAQLVIHNINVINKKHRDTHLVVRSGNIINTKHRDTHLAVRNGNIINTKQSISSPGSP